MAKSTHILGILAAGLAGMLCLPWPVLAGPGNSGQPLQEINAGPAVPVAPYLSHLLAGQDQPLVGVEFPLVSRLKPGRLKTGLGPVLDSRWLTEPVFVVGSDESSMAWLARHADALRRLGASGVVLAAQNVTAFKRVQQLANEHSLPITHGPDRWLEQRLISQGAAVLPLLILLDGHATQEPTP